MHPLNEAGQQERQEYPKHMFNGKFKKMAHGGDDEPVFIVVKDEKEEKAAAKKGWKTEVPVLHPPKPEIPEAEEEAAE